MGMKRKRPEGSGCTLGCRAGLWGVLRVQCWLMGCSQGTRGQQDPAAATTVGCSDSSGASPWEPAGGEPQTLLGGAGGIAASCLGWASHPQVCAAAAEASPVAHGHWECSELHQPHNFLGPGLDPKVAPHALGQSQATPQRCPCCGGLKGKGPPCRSQFVTAAVPGGGGRHGMCSGVVAGGRPRAVACRCF